MSTYIYETDIYYKVTDKDTGSFITADLLTVGNQIDTIHIVTVIDQAEYLKLNAEYESDDL